MRTREPPLRARFAGTAAAAWPYVVVGLLALAALVVSQVLRHDADSDRKEQVLAAKVGVRVQQMATAEQEALAEKRFSGETLEKWRAGGAGAANLVDELGSIDGDDRQVVAEIRNQLSVYRGAVRAERAMLVRGLPEEAERTDELWSRPAREAINSRLRVVDRKDAAEAARANTAATVGSVGAFGMAALLIAIVLLRVQRSRRRAAVHRARQRVERQFRALVEQASEVVLVVDPAGMVTFASGGVEAQLRRDGAELLGKPLLDLLHPDDVELAVRLLAEARELRREHAATEWRMARGDGSFIRVEAMARDLTGDRDVKGLVLTIRDISERKAFEEQLRHQAFHDPLTHLPNRALFDDRLAHALSREKRDDRYVAVLFIDLDDFKTINDSLGHAAGDQFLITVAARLRACLRSADTAARLGGDEFGVVLEGLGNRAEASAAAQRALDSLSEPFFMHGEPVQIQASIGVAAAAATQVRAEQLVRDADVAMYLAKHNGKGRYELYDRELQEDLLEQLEIPTDEEGDSVTWFLRAEEQRAEIEALLDDENSITPVFQPIAELGTGAVVGYEALARFPPPSERPPNAWFAEAHRCGLGVELEMQALRASLRAEGRPAGTWLTLNLSPSAVVSGQLEENLPDDLSSLVFEIVETELISEGTRLELALDKLRARGARVAVDDTGSGYAGLKQLMRLRPEIIKLDRSLVDGLHADLAKRALVESMVRYARRIGASVCAEGVETLEDLQTLADIDISSAQGFVLARPGPPWPRVDAAAIEVCTNSMKAALGEPVTVPVPEGGADRQLEQVSRAILGASWPADLHRAVELLGKELDAEAVVLLRLSGDGTALETVTASGLHVAGDRIALADFPTAAAALADERAVRVDLRDADGDPNQAAALARRGLSSLLMVPVLSGDRTVGLLEIHAADERSWTRSQIHRGWIFAYELGAALAGFERDGKDVASGRLAHRNDFAATGIQWMRNARTEGMDTHVND